ncbi:unnamed protein product [Phytophthora fragariaefolia]|uniref:Unnamed protein product n=1 Tax=Phytophthora fragariaefolia TaxID=1490495 RepID=A0A9W6TPJ0_9STRA|nr:unnamed protein product [Phytophthora fragariaefolia]
MASSLKRGFSWQSDALAWRREVNRKQEIALKMAKAYQAVEKARRASENNDSLCRQEKASLPQPRINENSEDNPEDTEDTSTPESPKPLVKPGDSVWFSRIEVDIDYTRGPCVLAEGSEEFGDRPKVRLTRELTDETRLDFEEELLPEDSWEPDKLTGEYEPTSSRVEPSVMKSGTEGLYRANVVLNGCSAGNPTQQFRQGCRTSRSTTSSVHDAVLGAQVRVSNEYCNIEGSSKISGGHLILPPASGVHQIQNLLGIWSQRRSARRGTRPEWVLATRRRAEVVVTTAAEAAATTAAASAGSGVAAKLATEPCVACWRPGGRCQTQRQASGAASFSAAAIDRSSAVVDAERVDRPSRRGWETTVDGNTPPEATEASEAAPAAPEPPLSSISSGTEAGTGCNSP